MKKLTCLPAGKILPLILFLLMLFPTGIFAQDNKACSDIWRSERYACGEAYSKCYEQCGAAPGIAPESCYKACDDTSKACEQKANANLEACKNAIKKNTPKPELKEDQTEPKPGSKITCDQVWKIVGSENCERWVASNGEGGVWCNLPDTRESLQPWIYGPAPTYTFTPGTCTVESEAQPEEGLETKESGVEVGKQKEQPKIGLPLFATGWQRLFETFWNAAGVNVSSIIKNINKIGGMDHTLCDPANCEISLENLQRKTGLSEEEIINRPPSVREREINPYKLQRQNGDVYIGDYDKAKGFILKTGKDGTVFQTFYSSEGDTGGIEVAPNSQMNLPPQPFQFQKVQDSSSGQTPTKVELESGAAEFFIIGSAEKSTTKPTFAVATPNTEIKVFGTHFWVKHDSDKQQTIVGVYEGKVEVITKDGKKTTVTPDGDEPGIVLVTSKLSIVKLAVAGLILVVVTGGAIMILRRKFSAKGYSKKKK